MNGNHQNNTISNDLLLYSAGLMSESFWFLEFKQAVKLRAEGASLEEIEEKCLQENTFGYSKAYRLKRVTGYILSRVRLMDDTLVSIFMNSDLQTQKLINLITVLRKDRLFFEFVYEVYREKVILGIPYMDAKDVNVFFSRKESQDEALSQWKDSTKGHLRSNYLGFLTEANLLTIVEKKKNITPPLVDVVLERYLKASGDADIVKAITGVM